jgi:hypothetical protein
MKSERLTTVYRVQDSDGRGPWKPGTSHRWVDNDQPHDRWAHLLPWYAQFGPVHEKVMSWEHGGCGCLTVECLRQWFTPGEYRKLLDLGYRAVSMRVDRIIAQSDIQVYFGREKRLKDDVTLIELYPE